MARSSRHLASFLSQGNDQSYALTGVSATAAIGAVVVSLTLALSGVSATAAAGTLAPTIEVALSGVSATGAVGSVSVALSGVAGTGAVGTLVPVLELTVTGTAGTSAVGSVAPEISPALTGVGGITGLGTILTTEDDAVALTGVSAAGAVGSVAQATGLTGVSATGAVGSVTTGRVLTTREFAVYMRFTGYNYGSTESYREAVWHDPLMVDLPQPEESLRDEFGIQSGDTLEVTVADTALRTTLEGGTLDGASVLIEWVTTSHYLLGDPVEDVFTRTYTVKGYTYRPGTVTLRLVNIEDVRLSAVYPALLFNATDWPEIFPEHIGRAVPVAVGTAVKIPCALIVTAAGVGPWKFAVSQVIAADTVLTVYRNGRVVDSGEYTVSTQAAGGAGYTVRTLSFAAEQVDFSGNLHVIECDVTANASSNAVTELNRILVAAGVTVDAATFAAGVSYATTNVMRVDLAYTEQREYSAIIFDLLHVCRASLKRNAVGAYELVQDTAQSVTWTYDELAGDLIQVTEYESADAPQNFTLAYRPNIADPNKLQYLISRNAGGIAGTEHLDAPYVRDHTAADRMNCYLALRRKYDATARADVYIDNVELGQVLAITSASFWSGSKSWKVKAIRRLPGCNQVDLQQYNTLVYDYTPQTFPADATTGYSPDYSRTPPAAPTSVTVAAQGISLNQDGVALSYAQVTSIVPSVNWKEIWFQATNTVTNEIYQGMGQQVGGGTYGVKLSGLRPNVAHTLVSWAVNAFNVMGVVSAAVNFTSTAWTSAPAAATSLSSIQGTGKQVQVKWTAATGTNIAGYDVYRKIGSGSYSVVATVTGTSYSDNNVSYGSTYTYKTVTRDRAGNSSVDSGTTAITPAVNVGTGDVVDDAINSGKRQAVNSSSQAYSIAAGAYQLMTFTTSGLTRQPVVTLRTGGNTILGSWTTDNDGSYTAPQAKLYNHGTETVNGTAIIYYW